TEAALESAAPAAPTPHVRLYRFFDGTRHVHMLDRFAGEAAGLTLQDDDIRLMQDPGRGAVSAIYGCVTRDGVDHFLSSDAACEGQRVEGPQGWAFSEAVPGTTPLYRCYHPGRRDHLATNTPDRDCGDGTGFVREGQLGHLPDAFPFPFLDDQRFV